MRIVRYASAPTPRLGCLVDDVVVDLADYLAEAGLEAPSDPVALAMSRLIEDAVAAMPAESQRRHSVVDAKLLVPIDRPGKIFALAANYSSHAAEVGEEARDKSTSVPHVFPKMPSTLAGPGDPILIPEISDMVDYEVELGVVIGTPAYRVSPTQAMAHVAGYVLFNDVSARRMIFPERPEALADDAVWDFLYGKWCDGFAITGPWFVSAHEITDPTDLRMSLQVNGQVRQSARVGDYTFTIPEAISFISRICTLEPGDLVAMGTPAGIGEMGLGCLDPGDIVEAAIDGLGKQRNVVQLATASGSQ